MNLDPTRHAPHAPKTESGLPRQAANPQPDEVGALAITRGTVAAQVNPALPLFPLEKVPDDALESMADLLALPDRVSLSLTSSKVNQAVTHRAADPFLNDVYKAQAELRRLSNEGASQSRLDEATNRFRSAVKLMKQRQVLQNQVITTAGKWDQALTTGQLDANVAHDAGRVLMQIGRFQKAEEVLAYALGKCEVDDEPHLLLLLAGAQQAQGKTEAARSTARSVLRHDESRGWHQVRACDFLMESHFLDGELQEASEWSPDEPEGVPTSTAWGMRAALSEFRARHAEANGEITKAQELRTESGRQIRLAQQNGQSMSIAQFHGLVGDTQAALAMIRRHKLIPTAGHPAFERCLADPNVAGEWRDYLHANISTPEQLATIYAHIDVPHGARES